MAHLADQITLEQHLRRESELYGWFPPLVAMITTMARAGKAIAYGLSNAEIDELVGAAGHDNKSGDHVQKLDIFAEETIERYAAASGLVSCMASEESVDLIGIPKGYTSGPYVLMFDPLDGSSNINANITVGTIWAVRLQTCVDSATPENYLQKGKTLEAAGYILYGARTQFVYTARHGVHVFTLSPESGEFILTYRNAKIPERGKVYSTNEGNTKHWNEGVKKYIQHLKEGDHVGRCSGAMIADFHRILLGGGIFFYPNHKLRLLYEAAPVALIASQAGGKATDGVNDILDIIPSDIHQKVPLIFGSKGDVQEYLDITGSNIVQMKLNALHNNITERAEQPAQGDPLDALRLDAPEGGAPAPTGPEEAPEAQKEASGGLSGDDAGHGDPDHKVSETIDAVEKLQSAAAAMEAAKFVIQTEWSDFSLAKALEQLKQQLIPMIGKAKEHMMQVGAKDPTAEKKVASWLDM